MLWPAVYILAPLLSSHSASKLQKNIAQFAGKDNQLKLSIAVFADNAFWKWIVIAVQYRSLSLVWNLHRLFQSKIFSQFPDICRSVAVSYVLSSANLWPFVGLWLLNLGSWQHWWLTSSFHDLSLVPSSFGEEFHVTLPTKSSPAGLDEIQKIKSWVCIFDKEFFDCSPSRLWPIDLSQSPVTPMWFLTKNRSHLKEICVDCNAVKVFDQLSLQRMLESFRYLPQKRRGGIKLIID